MSRARADLVSLVCTLTGIVFAGAALAWGWFGIIAIVPLGFAALLQAAHRGPSNIVFTEESWKSAVNDHGKPGFELTVRKADLGQGKVPVLYVVEPDGSLEARIPDFRLTRDGDLVVWIQGKPLSGRVTIA